MILPAPAPLVRAAAVLVVLLAAAVYFVLVELHRAALFPDFDVYIYFLPNRLHFVSSLLHGGKGLLWNPYQACGEPFFANPAMGLLYPPHLLFLVLDANTATHAVLVLNMVIGALGMTFLLRELGLGDVGVLGGALTFELGAATAQLTSWSPMHNGPWAWVPWALLFCERLLRAPSAGGIVALAAVLALGLLPGWVLLVALAYQLIVLRVAWEVVVHRGPRPWRGIAAVAAGLALAPLLVAVQLVPAAELARDSQRIARDFVDFWAYGGLTTDVPASIRSRLPPVPFMATPLLLAAPAVVASGHRRLVGFYLVAGAVYAVLALGPATPLFWSYVSLPPGGATLRYPHRLFWITSLACAMLCAYGLDGVTLRSERPLARLLGVVVALLLAGALYFLTPGGLRRVEALSLAIVVASLLTAAVSRRLRQPSAWLIVGAIVLNLVAVPLRFPGGLLPSADALWRHADAFAALRAAMTAQDRVFIGSSLSSIMDLGLVTKTATIMRIPDVYDYEPLLGRRLTNYFSAMWHGSPIISGQDLTTRPTVLAGFRARLSDLAAVRYIITPSAPRFFTGDLDLFPIDGKDPNAHVYASRQAFSRARWVPQIEVIADPEALLARLAYGTDDLADVAFLEDPLPSGFAGEPRHSGSGTVRFVRDDPEHIVLDVEAPARGFLLLADQHSPGWRASVDGAPATIRRANYTFRLIEVPAGASRVEFRYRPRSVAIGALISAAALAAVAVVLVRGRGRARGTARAV